MNTFKRGDNHEYVKKIQRALNELVKAGLRPDGNFGALSEGKLKEWQSKQNLTPDGVYSGKTAEVLGAYIEKRYLKDQDFVDAAAKIGAEVNAVKAVQMVESRGAGFLSDGRVIILFERHIFKRQLDAAMDASAGLAEKLCDQFGISSSPGQSLKSLVQAHLVKTAPDLYNASGGGYIGNEAEHDRLKRAIAIDKESAYRSASWGLFQIMGFHAKLLKFASAVDMVAHYESSERNQLLSFCDFILADKNLTNSIRAKDFTTFARWYNGPGFAKNFYDKKMLDAYNRLKAS